MCYRNRYIDRTDKAGDLRRFAQLSREAAEYRRWRSQDEGEPDNVRAAYLRAAQRCQREAFDYDKEAREFDWHAHLALWPEAPAYWRALPRVKGV